MRSSLLKRSVVAVASLAIGSVALAATPATAATSAGTTRDEVLSLASAARANGNLLSPSASVAARAILRRECKPTGGKTITDTAPVTAQVVAPNTTVDGVYLLVDLDSSGAPSGQCAVTVVAPVAAGTTLSGQATLTTREFTLPTRTAQSTLSGDVGVNVIPDAGGFFTVSGFSYSADGTATTTKTSTTVTKVKTPKSKAQKKAAKKKYEKRLKAAKKSYKKALAKAKNSKSKKAAAKKAYKAKRASAKAAYKKAVASFKLVTRTSTTTSDAAFKVTASGGTLAP